MRKTVARLAAVVAAVVAGMGAAQADDAAALLARGAYLVNGPVACGNCHTPRAKDMSFVPGMDFAGGFEFADPGFHTYSSNITPDKETGIGNWTDAQIIAAIREGKNPAGHIIWPPMPVPTYNNMSDTDAKAIVAYLRTVKPVHHAVPAPVYNIPQQAMPPAKGLDAPPASEKVAYGGYIVTALSHCFECHVAMDAHGAPDFSRGAGAGGFEIKLAPSMGVRTPNITPDPETGIGKWSDAEIKTAITKGIRPDGRHLAPPMPYGNFAQMTPQDLDAVVAFIRSIPPVKNAVERTDFQKKAFN